MITCKTLLGSLIKQERALLIELFGLSPGAALSVYCQKDSFGIRVE